MPTNHAIVGREAELQQLREVVESAARPVVAFVEGDAGVGKTALLEAIVGRAAEGGTRVLRARPTAAEAASSFAALDDLLRPAIEGLPRLAEPQRRALAAALLLEAAIDPVDPRLVGLACLSLLEALPGRVLLAVDDWQWLDAASAAVLSFVLRRLEPGGAKVIATVRRGEADEAVAGLVRALPVDQVIELAVGPLDPGALGRLVHARTGTWMAPPALARLHAACEGNPLLALELVRAPGAEAASDIRRLLAARVGALAPETRTVLRFVAALAEPTLAAVEAAVDAPGGLEEALAADVLVRDGSRLRFSHPLIGAVVEERTPLGEWRAIHARLAELTDHPEQRARHLAAAADGPDEAVAAALEVAAGEAATRGAMMAAADLAERAAELTPSTDQPVRLRRLLHAAEAAMAVGDGPRARGPLEEVLARAGAGPLRAAALHKLAYVVMDDSALELAESALVEAGTDEALLAEVHLTASMFAAMGGDGTALRHADAAVRHAEATGQPFLLSQALSNIAFLRHCAGGGVQRELLLRADALERAESVPGRDDTPLEVLGMQLYVNGDLAESRELLTAELERAQARGYLEHESFATLLLAELEVRAGRWQLAEGFARQTLELTLGSDLWNAEAAGHCTVAVVDAHLGRVASAREHAETGRRQATDLGDLGFATKCSHILGFVALSLGDPEGAVFHLAPLRANEAQLNIREPAMFCIGPDAAEALVLAGDLDAAREVQAELEARGRTLGRAWAIATGLRCRGLIAAVEGRSDDALAALHEAIAVHAEVPQPFDRARTLLVLGSTQRRFKQRAEARGSLEAALAVFEELGAALWAERARAEIARLGGRRARDRDELTETERRIAELAAVGRSNREIAGELFVSERTVESNLTRAYRKLGVRSRTELARRLPTE
ncbi:MAG TPA: AAA family ATPase [Solirubrobacteraceae bacterium]|nr:AAA family ATPase [Solirubrobacteraceae bacterium]